MPMYDPFALYTDPILTGFSTGYRAPTLVALDLMPQVDVNTGSGRYRVYGRERRVVFPSRREPGTTANEIRGGRWSEDVFYTQEHSLQAAVADEERQEFRSLGGYANPAFGGSLTLDPEQDAVALVNGALQLEHEITVATLLKNTATYPVGNTVTFGAADQWDNYAGATSNPIDIIRAAVAKIDSLVGQPPNLMAIGRLGVPWLENHPDIVARFQNWSLLQPDAFQRLTGFEGRVVTFGEDKYNTNDIQEATESLTELWGKDVILMFNQPDLSEEDLSFGKTFAQIYPDGSTKPTDRWREEGRKSDLVRTSWKYGTKVTTSSAGYLIKNAFSATAW